MEIFVSVRSRKTEALTIFASSSKVLVYEKLRVTVLYRARVVKISASRLGLAFSTLMSMTNP